MKFNPLRYLVYGSTFALLCHGALAAPAASPQPTTASSASVSKNAQVVSQKYDAIQSVTETHLANGLTILTKEDHAAPVAYFSVYYKVGSRDEISGTTGLSHILEHMMFKGTKDLPPGSISALFQRNGGEINAQTGQDFTYYHELIAGDRLELAVRIEADRMENSLFDPEQLKHEMTVVRSELEGDFNDAGYQLYDINFLPAAFVAHPYHWPTLGWRSDVEAVANNRQVIYDYYRNHYMPNNAVVVIVGDFDTKAAVGLCQKYFGVYGSGHLVTHHITPEPPQNGERRTVLKRPGTEGEVLIGYHVPGIGTEDHYTLDVISQILSGGRSARLYQALVDTGLASGANGGDPDMKDPFLFTIDANDRAGVDNDTVEKALEAELEKLKTSPVTARELQTAFNQIDASFTFQNDTVSAQGDQIGQYAAIGDYHYLDTYLQRIHKITPAEIQAVAQKYFTQDNRTVALFEPQPLPPGAVPGSTRVVDNFGAVAPVTSPTQKATLAELDKKFNTTTLSLGKPIRPTKVVLPNGLTVIVEENHSNHTVAMTGYLKAGALHDPDGKWGLASITASLLERGTTTKSALELARQLESVGANVGIGADTDSVDIGGGCLTKNFSLTLSTLADELLNPSFPPAELEKVRGETLSGLEQSRQDAGGTGGAGALASIAFAQALYPQGHPYWAPSIDQSEAAIKSLTVSDLSDFYKTYYRPDTMVLVIVGDVKTADALSEVKSDFGDWAKPATPPASEAIPDVPLASSAPQPQNIVIPGTDQTSILWGFQGGLKRTDKDFYATTLMNFVLGGSGLSARLGLTLRDRDGLCYTTYSDFDGSTGAGPFSVFVGSNPQNARRAIHELKGVVQRMHDDGPTAQELTEAKAYLTGVYPIRLEDNSGVAEQLMIAQMYGLGSDYIQKHASYYEKVTLAQVKQAARQHLHPDKAVLIIAGAPPAN